MRLLLDTHTLLWAVDSPSKIGAAAYAAMGDSAHDRLVSTATLWEIAIKAGLGKLNLSLPYGQWIDKALVDFAATVLPVDVVHCETYVQLPHHHGDPFDRMLAGQSLAESLTIVSADAAFDLYGVARIWQ